MMHLTARTATANYIATDGEIHLEFLTDKGKQVTVALRPEQGENFLTEVEDAVLEADHAIDKGAAGPWDRGRAA